MKKKTLAILHDDPWLEPFAPAIEGRHEDAVRKLSELTGDKMSLSDFANAHHYYGLHRTAEGWVFREWAPNATMVCLIGDFNDWKECAPYRLKRLDNGNWEIKLPARAMKHGDLFKLLVKWDGGEGERIPAYATRVVQDEQTKVFSAQVWDPAEPYEFKAKTFKPNVKPLLIYECHIGMAQDREGVGTYDEFRENILPRVKEGGYNAIQIMAIQEHPYYGSFGYHVSSFYAASSRFGTPDELKHLIDAAHEMGIAVIMDIVHSHAVKNEVEGLGRFDGSYNQYFYGDGRREHPAWDSLCFDYGKNDVLNFLLSNCKFWLEEYRFDGFRFDGVTSMLYYNHGLGQAFGSYDDYYNGNEDTNAITYLTLANLLIHEVNPHAITIAEEMSGMPGLARKFKDGGIGFDYRMAMGIPDYWIKTIKERKDEDWKPTSIFWELTNRRADEKTISYAESHDQALVGDKTIIFRLIDKEMYWHMMVDDHDGTVERGIWFSPEMKDLYRCLQAGGITPYVCSASLELIVEVLACDPELGVGLPPEQVFGLRFVHGDKLEAEFTIPYYPHVSVGWDNSPRFGDSAVVKENTPERFEEALRRAKAWLDARPKMHKLITINSWNEWTETSYLQPDNVYGYGYLDAVKHVFGPVSHLPQAANKAEAVDATYHGGVQAVYFE